VAGADRGGDGVIAVTAFAGDAALTLTAGPTEFTVLPEVGLLGASLRHRGAEYLDLRGGADAARGSHTTGLPLLAPWANRLGENVFEVAGRKLDLSAAPGLHRDANGLPIHGTLVGRVGWELTSLRVARESAAVVARFRAGDDADVMASFPFPHDITVTFTVSPGRLTVATMVEPTGPRAVPVSFGWHPYFRLPGVGRDRLKVELPDRKRFVLDDRQLPTSAKVSEAAAAIGLSGRTFDDGYRLGRDRQLTIRGGRRRLVMTLDRGYPCAQVYSPEGEDFVALEPMTAPTDALCRDAAPLVEPGGRFSARFSLFPS
jgi:galactose mutarotase-like enzyme